MKRLIAIVTFFHFIFLAGVCLANTLQVDAAGNVVAETDRYLARFEKGILLHFHNKLTQETYTHAEVEQENEAWHVEEALFTTIYRRRVNALTGIKKTASGEVRITYQEHGGTHHFFIGIDPANSDLLIRQVGMIETGGAEHLKWGLKNLSHPTTALILPADGGVILNQEGTTEDFFKGYPGGWEAQLAIFQGRRGGFFVRADDIAFRFKYMHYQRRGEHFRVGFTSEAIAPFEERQRFESATWRLNAYQGDWHVPARLYRDWMHAVFSPPDRQQMPAWVNEIECVIKNHGDPDLEILKRLNTLVDPTKTLIYQYVWHEDGGDLPHRRDGFKTNLGYFIKEAQRYGFKIMFHTSMSHIQMNDPSYATFEKYHVIHPYTGEKQGYKLNDPTYHSPAATINPASRAFRKMFVSELKYAWETYGFDAMHLDFTISVENDKNGRIDGLTMAEGTIALHQEIKETMPGLVLSGESLTELSAPYEEFVQRWYLPENYQPHLISNFLFSDVRLYGHLGLPNPDHLPEEFQARQKAYTLWGVLPTITIWDVESLGDDRVRTHQLLTHVRQRQGYVFGDVSKDGVVNILDLVLVANNFNGAEPDVNKDGIVNVLDLVTVANEF